jgi:hypothetical protein
MMAVFTTRSAAYKVELPRNGRIYRLIKRGERLYVARYLVFPLAIAAKENLVAAHHGRRVPITIFSGAGISALEALEFDLSGTAFLGFGK